MKFYFPLRLWNSQKFTQIPDGDDMDDSISKEESKRVTHEQRLLLHPRAQNSWQRSGLELSLALCVSSLILGAYLLTSVLRNKAELRPTGREFGDCGEQGSIEQARAAGCIFDPIASIWTQPECYDTELAEEFISRIDYKFWANESMVPENEVPLEEWLAGDWPFILPDKKYHYMHCYYVWEKLQRAYLNKWPLDSQVAGMAHTKHCSVLLMDPVFHTYGCGSPDGCIFYARTSWTSCGYH